MMNIIKGRPENASPDLKEALRYMGYKGHTPDPDSMMLIEECKSELLKAVSPVCCYMYTEIRAISEDETELVFGKVKSRDLARHLKGCTGAYLFAATIGISVDRLISKYSRIKPAKGVITDALGSSSIESFCDFAELEITKDITQHCSRFSAGYGDFSLSHQTDFMRCLDMNRTLGITLSDSLLMTPTKSVTAVIGIGASNRTCASKCISCPNTKCIYRDSGH